MTIDLIGTHPRDPQRLKISVNGDPQTVRLKPGVSEKSLTGAPVGSGEQIISLDLAPEQLRLGGNCISLNGLEGSWIIFDALRYIGGFSHIHEWTMAGLLMMPVTGPLQVEVGDPYQPDSGYRSRIDKTSEEAGTGYYRALLTDYDIEAELTATTRASFQRYHFRRGDKGRVMIDLQVPSEYEYNLNQVEIRKVSNQRLEGYAVQHAPNVWSRDAEQEYTLHFVIEFDRPMTSLGSWTGDGIQTGVQQLRCGKVADAGVFAEFDTDTQRVLQIRTGISLVSVENAGLNLNREIQVPFGWDYDWTVAQYAKALAKEATYQEFMERSTWWKNMFDPETGYARLRNADGQWVAPFDPYRSGANKHYVEGNAWQLTFFVPQDLPGLIEQIGRERFLRRLEEGFERSVPMRFNAPNELYWDYPVVHGNQQSMHFAFLFNWAGAPWLTQKYSREILDRYYGYGSGDAYLGDEDQGQMSAWFVMAALGLFQMDGGCRVDPVYEIGSPLFERATIRLHQGYYPGGTFTIEARGVSRRNRYIQSATLNGRPLNRPWFPQSEVIQGGSLRLEMGPDPGNRRWGDSAQTPSSPPTENASEGSQRSPESAP